MKYKTLTQAFEDTTLNTTLLMNCCRQYNAVYDNCIKDIHNNKHYTPSQVRIKAMTAVNKMIEDYLR